MKDDVIMKHYWAIMIGWQWRWLLDNEGLLVNVVDNKGWLSDHDGQTDSGENRWSKVSETFFIVEEKYP